MALTLLKSPNKVAPVFLPVQYEFLYTQQLSAPSAFLAGRATVNHLGFLAIRNAEGLVAGNRFYLAKQNSPNLYQPKPVNVTERAGILNADLFPPIEFVSVTDIPYNETLSAVDCYTLDYIRNLQPQFHLYVEGNYLAPVAPIRQPNGQLVVRLNSYLQSCFEDAAAPPFVGINPQLKKFYQLRYSEGGGTLEDFEKHVIFSSEGIGIPECAEARDVITWQAEAEYCLKDSYGGNTGNKAWSTLRKYVNGVSTGETKPNAEGDPFYRAPVVDTNFCAVPSREVTFVINNPRLENGVGKIDFYGIAGGNPADGEYHYSLDGTNYLPLTSLQQTAPGVYLISNLTPGETYFIYLKRGTGDAPATHASFTVPEDEADVNTELTAYKSNGQGIVNFSRNMVTSEVLTLWYEVYNIQYGSSEKVLIGTSTIAIPAGQLEFETAIPFDLNQGGQHLVRPIKIVPATYNMPEEDYL